MKKFASAFAGAALLLAGVGVVQASAEPGPNGNNDHGLCTAYFNGQKKGHDEHGSPGPFAGLEEAAEASGTREEIASAVYQWCTTMAGDGEGVEIGGQPDANGRWTCTTDDNETADTSDDTYECTDNPDKGGKPA